MNALLGKQGETFVCDYLIKQGYTIIERNYACSGGEIDIIAQKKLTILFVEVKTRSQTYIDPALSITQSKQKKIIRTAKKFSVKHNADYTYRFDVALVIHTPEKPPTITYLEDAFQAEE